MRKEIEVYIFREYRTQRGFADAVVIRQTCVSDLVRGRRPPSLSEREKLIRVMGLKRFERYFRAKPKCEPGPERYRKFFRVSVKRDSVS